MSKSNQKIKNISDLKDGTSERYILSSILQHGQSVFHDINTIIQPQYFYFPENRFLYEIFKKLIIEDNITNLDGPTVLAKVSSIDSSLITKYEIPNYIEILNKTPINPKNITPSVQFITRLGIARNLINQLEFIQEDLLKTSGNESVIDLLSKVEDPISQFTSQLVNEEDITLLSEEIMSYVEHVAEHQPSNQGIPTGYPIYDKYIGGGLRAPGVHLLGGRAGSGKSQVGINISYNVSNIGIPVLYLDTELSKEIVLSRLSARISNTPIDIIETGQFANDILTKKNIYKKIGEVTKNPLFYYNISGKSHKEWISIIRRWLMKHVKFDENGKINPCLVVLDYLKTMDLSETGDFQEYQYLGQIITDLHNLCIKYNFPIFSLIQLNRDGIDKDDQSIVSGSDRLVWLCSSLAYIKPKQQEDYADDPETNGNKKLIISKARFGSGTQSGEYINLITDFSRSIVLEGNTNLENRKSKGSKLVLSDNGKSKTPINI